MTYRLASLAALVVIESTALPAAPPKLTLIKTRVTVVLPDGSMKEALQEVKGSQLHGEYYQGDGLACNLNLVLQRENK